MINPLTCEKQEVTFTELGYDNPGGSYIDSGNNSGEEYYENFFQDKFHNAMLNKYQIVFNDEKIYGLPHTYFRTIIELCIETYGVKLVKKYINIKKSKISVDYKILFDKAIKFYSNKPIDYKHPDNLRHCKRYN